MPNTRTWLICITTIPTLLILLAFSSSRFPSPSWINCLREETLTMHLHRTLLKQCPTTGRYIDVRKHFGLEERLVFAARPPPLLGTLAARPFRQREGVQSEQEVKEEGTESQVSVLQRRNPMLRRALEFTLEDSSRRFPDSSDASQLDRQPLKLTEDSSWDYSHSKREIIDAFARSAQRDTEEVLAEIVTKQAKTQAREKKLRKSSAKRPKRQNSSPEI